MMPQAAEMLRVFAQANNGGFPSPPWYDAGNLEVQDVLPQAIRLIDKHGNEAIYVKEVTNS